ncbi:MAG: hypothetical protein JW909_11095 [Planctomycetes bacterium]|nr:hypothetical protein [Planctomycetota bacterium]
MRKPAILALVCTALACSCGGPGAVTPRWEAEPAWAAPVKGLALAIESGSGEYPAGTPVFLKVHFKNSLLKVRYLDVRNNCEGLSLEITGPDGEVEAAEGKGEPEDRGDFLKLEPDGQMTIEIRGPENSNWSYDLSAPGTYRIKAVYKAEISSLWNRLSAAAGKYEGEVLYTGRFVTPEVTIEVKAPEKKR